MSRGRQRAITFGILVLAFALPVVIAHLTTAEPRTRRIHVEHFRYGMQPEVIHVNRGDTVILTFSARDTAHSFFLQEYDLDVKIPQQTGQVAVAHPSRPEDEPELTREVVFRAGRPGLMGFFNTKSRYRCHVWCGQMHAFEQGFFVVHPNYLHAGATGVLFALPLVGLLRWRWTDRPAREMFARDASALVPMGLFIWIAFAIPMLTVSWSFVLSTMSDPFNWEWDLFGTAGALWWQVCPEATPWIQAGFALIGYALALRALRRVWSAAAPEPSQALYGMLPSATLLFGLTYGLLWFFTA